MEKLIIFFGKYSVNYLEKRDILIYFFYIYVKFWKRELIIRLDI